MSVSSIRSCARRVWPAWLACLLLCSPTATPSQPVMAGDLAISGAWVRATVAGVDAAAVYVAVENRGRQPDKLLGAATPAAVSAIVHRTTHRNGVARMGLVGELDIAPGKTVRIEPGGLHIMLTGLKQPLAAGMHLPLTLRFQHAGTVSVQVQVVPITAGAPDGAHHGTSTHDRGSH